MQKMIAAALFLASLPVFAQYPRIIAYADKESALYKVNEPIKFLVSFIDVPEKKYKDPLPGNYKMVPGKKIDWELTGDGGYKTNGTIESADKPVVIDASLPRPGFVLLKLTLNEGGKEAFQRLAGAGVEPEKIESGTKAPPDFDAFWAKQIAQLRARKPEITVKDIAAEFTNRQAAVYDVRIADGVVNATGILTVPTNACPGKHAAIITFGGASWIGSSPAFGLTAKMNAIVFTMNSHDTKNIVAKEEVPEIRSRPGINDYYSQNADDLDKYIPITIFLRIIRALDYLKSRPEWDGKVLIASGPSFGGARSIVAAALDPQVTLCLPGAPAMCDHLGHLNNQIEGWPHLLRRNQYKSDKALFDKVVKVSPYYDCANFARRVKCETIFSVGFIDTVCPPTSVYAAYNNVPSANKKIINGPTAGHGDGFRLGEPGGFSAGNDPRLEAVCREGAVVAKP